VANATVELQTLLPGLKAGESGAYRELVRCMGEPLSRYALKITGDSAAAQDVVQDAFVRIYKGRRKLDDQLELRGLCFRTVRNLARNHVRDRSLRRRREQEGTVQCNHADPGLASLARDAWELVKGLPPTLREVIELRFTFGLSRSEIAATLEIPEGTVATRQKGALETLREQLQSRALAPVTLPAVAELLAVPQSTTPFPVPQMEELVMNAIRNARLKLATLVATAVAAALLLCISGTLALASALEPAQPGLNPVAAHSQPPQSPARSKPIPGGTQAQAARPENEAVPAQDQPGDLSAAAVPDTGPAEAPNPVGTDSPDAPPNAASPDSAPVQPAPLERAPFFASEPTLRAVCGEEYAYLVLTGGNPEPSLRADGAPAWLTLTGNLLRGTPAAMDAGSSAVITLIAGNGVGRDAVQRFELFVHSAPQITSTPGTDAAVGSAYTYKVTVKAEPKATLRLENAPSWLSLTGNVVSGTPAQGDAGEANDIKLVADNGVKPEAVQVWTILVKSPPQFDSAPVEKVTVGKLYTYELKVSGTPKPQLDAPRLPDWLELKDGKLVGTPRIADLGETKKITITAENGLKPDAKQSFKIEVVDDPAYVELPWTVDDMKDYFKVGLKWKLVGSETHTDSFGGMAMTHASADYACEVTAVDKDGFTVKIDEDTAISASTTGVKRTTASSTQTIKWTAALEFARRGMPGPISAKSTRTTATESISISGKSYKCTVLTWDEPVVDGDPGDTVMVYFCADVPIGPLQIVRFNRVGKVGVHVSTAKFTQTLASLTVPKK
jgi:RNA polymerase sigma-70 factor (ECF subfamily)